MEEEDLEVGWEYGSEYPPPGEAAKGKLRWVLEKGYWIGKKAVIAGVAISSAPVVLPPLVVFSTLGFAFSVPSGLVLAGYACTDKIMSKLLPLPTPVEYDYYPEFEEEEEEEEEEGGNRWKEDGVLMGDEMGLGFEEGSDEFSVEREGSITNSDGIVDEKGYVSDEDGEGEVVKEDGMEEEEKLEMEDLKQGIEARIELDEGGGGDYGAKEEVMGKKLDEEDDVEIGGNESDEVFSDEEIKITEPVVVKELESQKLAGEEGQEEEEEESVAEMRRVVVLEGGNEENNWNLREVEELDLVARETKADVGVDGKKTDALDGDGHEIDAISREKKEDLMEGTNGKSNQVEKMDLDAGGDGKKADSRDADGHENMDLDAGDDGKKADSRDADGHENDAISREKEENLNADARDQVANKSGLDLSDERNAGSYQNGSMNFETSEGMELAAEDGVDVYDLPAFRRRYQDLQSAKLTSKEPSSEGFMNEAKLWEQIGALRAVVGYNVKCQPTFAGELKALYVFTGVEPPASFKDDSDLVQVNDNLKFLMSIVGVK